ncbi:beta-catenin-like protein 1 [Rhodotorula toruloides]|uniref:Beta-catenin-like protein 1 n=1 Tax=Rhodotorula toruloides TaxID=5286 RepID=A0A511KF53_RHOTO|nr:beta-catenin-like protein 1 [Rhodotorula toruloides]
MDIDDIFKRPPLPKSTVGSKRKHEAPPLDPESYKSVRLDTPSGPAPTASADKGKGKGKAKAMGVSIQDGSDDEDDAVTGAQEGEFAPNGDADYFAEEDEDGRFFGGGLNTVQKEVLSILEGSRSNAQLPGEDLTPQSVRKQLLNLEKAVNKNRDLRTRFPSDPEKFVDSEFNLLEAIRAVFLFSTKPAVAYPLMLENSTPNTFADLLSHENMDVPIAVVEVLEELLDPEDLDEVDEDEEDADGAVEKKRTAMKALLDGLVEAGVIDLVVAQLQRVNEEDEGERNGLIENLVSLSPALASPFLSPKSPFLSFLVDRLSQTSKPVEYDQNRFYAAEMFALVLSLPAEVVQGVNEARQRIGSEGWVEILLKVLSTYRKRDPVGSEEEEYMENVFDALCSCLSSPTPPPSNPSVPPVHAVKAAFLADEGIELLVLMLKAKNMSRNRAIKTLDHALQGREGATLCERFVEALGLKTLFAAFMGRSDDKKKRKAPLAATHGDTEHILAILSSLFTSLPSDSPPRMRLLAKFVENDYEKIDRLLEIREELENRIAKGVDPVLAQELDEDELYLEKLDNGLFALQLADYVTAWVCMEDDGARDHVLMLLSRRDKSLRDVIAVLNEYADNIGEVERPEDVGEDAVPTEGEERKAILAELARYLESLA